MSNSDQLKELKTAARNMGSEQDLCEIVRLAGKIISMTATHAKMATYIAFSA